MTDAAKPPSGAARLAAAVLAVSAILVALAFVQHPLPSEGWGLRESVIAGAVAVGCGVLAWLAAGAAKRRWAHLRDWMRRHVLALIVAALLLLWFVVYLAFDIFIAIKPGQGGVLWKRFGGGTVTERFYGEGLHVIPPWDEMYVYDLRVQQQSLEFEVLSVDGLLYTVEVSVRFRLRQDSLGFLHKCVGPNYVDTMLLPEVGAVTRLIIAQLKPDELYTSQRQASEAEIRVNLRLTIASCPPRQERDASTAVAAVPAGQRYFEASDVFIRRVVLPLKVAEAIESKLAQRQQMLEYDYRIDKERKEAERKAIEANGIRTFNQAIARDVSPAVLQWRGIEATLELAKSPNSKVVIFGANEKGGLPLILGSLPAGPGPATPAGR